MTGESEMLSPLSSAVMQICPLGKTALNALESQIEAEFAPRNTELLTLGQVAHTIYFVEKGLARAYYLRDGRDITDYFAMDNQFIGAVPSLFTQLPSHKAIQILEDAQLWRIGLTQWEKLCADHHEIERLGRKLAIFGMLTEQNRIESIRFLSAAERYAELEATHPGISNRCPLKHIATYLGISQVSLSRIRAGIQ